MLLLNFYSSTNLSLFFNYLLMYWVWLVINDELSYQHGSKGNEKPGWVEIEPFYFRIKWFHGFPGFYVQCERVVEEGSYGGVEGSGFSCDSFASSINHYYFLSLEWCCCLWWNIRYYEILMPPTKHGTSEKQRSLSFIAYHAIYKPILESSKWIIQPSYPFIIWDLYSRLIFKNWSIDVLITDNGSLEYI